MCNEVFYGPHLPPKSCVTAKPVNIKPVVLLCYETQAQSGGSAASVSVPDTTGHPQRFLIYCPTGQSFFGGFDVLADLCKCHLRLEVLQDY